MIRPVAVGALVLLAERLGEPFEGPPAGRNARVSVARSTGDESALASTFLQLGGRSS